MNDDREENGHVAITSVKHARDAASAEPSPRSLVSLRSVGKSFGHVEALRDLSLDVRRGELLALLGPSGCGKSTALRMIAGLTAPDTGGLAWHDPAARQDLGVVFQDPTLMPWTDVRRNVWLPLRLRGQSLREAEGAIHDALDLVGLREFAGAYPRELSGGMKMRASVARALVTRPRLLLMDEPFATLDEITRHRLNDDLLALRERTGVTILFVTHSVFESVFLADRVAVMTLRPGRLAGEVRVDEPYPRASGWRTSARYAETCGEVSSLLREAMGEGG